MSSRRKRSRVQKASRELIWLVLGAAFALYIVLPWYGDALGDAASQITSGMTGVTGGELSVPAQ